MMKQYKKPTPRILNLLENASKLNLKDGQLKNFFNKGNFQKDGPYYNKVQVKMPGVFPKENKKHSNSSISVVDSAESFKMTPVQEKQSIVPS